MARKSKTKRRIVKEIFGYIHLWLGLTSGLIIFTSMLGASVFVWEKELTDWYYSDVVFINDKIQDHELLPISALHQAVSKAYPNMEFTFMEAFNNPQRNYAWMSYKDAETTGWTWPSGVEYYIYVYVNPYTGKVTGHIDKRTDWIMLSRFLHQTLLLEYETGSFIISIAGLIMIVMALSGLVLWWPKTVRSLKQRLKVKWKASFKRKNWDIHAVGGFYTWLFLLFFATTGLVYSFQWWRDGIYKILGNDPSEVFRIPPPPPIDSLSYLDGMDKAFVHAIKNQTSWKKMNLFVPSIQYSVGTVAAAMFYERSDTWWLASDYFYYNPTTGKPYHSIAHGEKLTAEKWILSNYAMHVGSIYGTPTKIIAFICALIFAVLPVSGFLIWWGRKNKKNKHKVRDLQAEPKIPSIE